MTDKQGRLSSSIGMRCAKIEQSSELKQFSETTQNILSARGITTADDLDLSLKNLPTPTLLANIDSAIELLTQAVKQQKTILVCGDYDVDGATSVALLMRLLPQFGLNNVSYIVPNRFDFGYGLSPALVDYIVTHESADLLITVDNGISSVEGVQKARDAGMQVLVTDHHLPGNELPNADAIVNPNLSTCNFPSKNLAGVGVAFYLMIALRASLRGANYFKSQGLIEPQLENVLDLVALGTVADVVPLDKVNRALVQSGINLIRSDRGCLGVNALCNVANKDTEQLKSSDFGFAIGPLINAAGRLEDVSVGIECLLTNDADHAAMLAADLKSTNVQRRKIQQQMLEEAATLVEHWRVTTDSLPWGYCAMHEDWHQGVVGLVSSRLVEKLYRPVISFAPDSNPNLLKGSGRSISGLHIRDCLQRVDAMQPNLIQKFGGHAMAAGLTIKTEDYEHFAKCFDAAVKEVLTESDLLKKIWVDKSPLPHEHDLELAKQLESIVPWGAAMPEPEFFGLFTVARFKWLKELHLQLELKLDAASSGALKSIWFNVEPNTSIAIGSQIEAVYQLTVNRYMGREQVQLIIRDAEIK